MSQHLLELVIKHAEVRGKKYHVLVQLAAAADSGGEVRLSTAELRHRTRSTDDGSLYAALKHLQRLGYVQKWGRRHTANSHLVVNQRALNRDALLRKKREWQKRVFKADELRKLALIARTQERVTIKGITDALIAKSFRKLR